VEGRRLAGFRRVQTPRSGQPARGDYEYKRGKDRERRSLGRRDGRRSGMLGHSRPTNGLSPKTVCQLFPTPCKPSLPAASPNRAAPP
jgi:hypothetical protein